MTICRLLVVVAIPLVLGICGAKADWPQFRHGPSRQADQYNEKVLNRPDRVLTLHLGWASPFHVSGGAFGAFTSSPIVSEGKLYIGNTNGYFYSVNVADGTQIWQYPTAGNPPLRFSIPLQSVKFWYCIDCSNCLYRRHQGSNIWRSRSVLWRASR